MPKRTDNSTRPKRSTTANNTAPKTTTKKDITVEEGKASVTYLVSITKNTGNFSSLKIQAGITIPHGADDKLLEELDELLVVSREKVVSRLSSDLDDISNSI